MRMGQVVALGFAASFLVNDLFPIVLLELLEGGLLSFGLIKRPFRSSPSSLYWNRWDVGVILLSFHDLYVCWPSSLWKQAIIVFILVPIIVQADSTLVIEYLGKRKKWLKLAVEDLDCSWSSYCMHWDLKLCG